MAKSRTRTSTRRKSTRRKQNNSNRLINILLLIVFLGIGAYYIITGNDPIGLFDSQTGGTLPPSVGSGGDWWEVAFTNPPQDYNPNNLSGSIPEKLINRINSAQSSIDIAAFEFNLTPVAEALINAHNRGVQVRWVTDDEYGLEADADEGHGQFAMLEQAGIPVKDDGRFGLMHNKFIIFDRQTVWTGSTNLTSNGNFRNNNNVIVVESPQVAAIYEREFAEMWEGAFGPTSPSTLTNQVATIGETAVQVLFGPEDAVIDHLTPLITAAQSRIRFMAFSFTNDDLGLAMLAQAQNGIDLRGIFETRGSETEYSELPKMLCAGVPVRQDGNPATFHHKVIIIDDQIVVTGSFNFSDSANEDNDENVFIIANTDIAAQYVQEFERRWAEAGQPEGIECQ